MASFDRGTKRQCLNCGTKFYDLSRSAILCPHCGKVFHPSDKPVPRYAKDEEEVEEVEVEEVVEAAAPEIVSYGSPAFLETCQHQSEFWSFHLKQEICYQSQFQLHREK